jgi:hypothetical protein
MQHNWNLATVAIVRRAAARKAIAPAPRVLRDKAKAVRSCGKQSASVQTVQNKVETIRKGLRGSSPSATRTRAAAEMTLKQQALAGIKAAWQKIEKYNLEFGKVCCEWRDKFKAQGFRKEGDGVSPILDELGIPKSTAYWWMNKYEISIGAKTAKPEREKPEASSPWTVPRHNPSGTTKGQVRR